MSAAMSVLIPTCNRRPHLERCLEALAGQTLAADQFEVVVVDDGSRDDTPAFLDAAGARLPFVLRSGRQENRGPAAARNHGLRLAQAPLVTIINDDTLLAPAALAQHLRFHTTAPPRAILLGTFRIRPEYKADLFTAAVDATTFIFPFCRLNTRVFLDYPFFITCNTSLSRAAFDSVGPFDERFPKPAGEDIEMGCRLYQAGWRIRFDPEILSWHDSLFTPASYARARLIRGEEDMRFLHYHPDQVRIYQRHALAFAKTHAVRLQTAWEDYQDYVDSGVRWLERAVAETEAAPGPGLGHRAMHKVMTGLEKVGYLAYALGAGRSPWFGEIMDQVYPQAVF